MKYSGKRKGRKSKERGFTLIELMVVVAIIGILLSLIALAIQIAIQKARLAGTEADIKTVGMAWCAEFGGYYSNIGPGITQPANVDITDFSTVLDAAQRLLLEALLDVTLPQYDAWGEEIEYRVDAWPTPTRLMIRSKNADKAWEAGPYQWKTFFPYTDRDTDIVWVNCDWVQFWC